MKRLLLLLFALLITSCVGVIEQSSKPTDRSKLVNPAKITFAGVERADVYSHQRIRLSFKPASGGSGVFSYIAYINANNTYPVASISPEASEIDESGELHITVDNLSKGTSYNFSVKAFDENNKVEDSNNVLVRATTLTYEVPIFDGIKTAANMAGELGQTQVKITWNPASEASAGAGGWGTNPQAISAYTIWGGTSPDTMTLLGTENDITRDYYVVTNLTSNTTYYFRVRALNSTSTVDTDKNLEYKSIKTRREGEAISFKGLTTASIPTSAQGLSMINLAWEQGSGDFDRYRIYVSATPKSSFTPGQDAQFGVDITDLSIATKQISAGSPHTLYYIAVVACKDASCLEYKGHDVVKTVKTSPPVAPFNGIKAVSLPSGADALSTVILQFDEPSTSLGIYDTLKVFLTDSNGNYNSVTDLLPTYNLATPAVIGIDPATLTSKTSRTIKGMIVGNEYCFIVKAYSTTPVDPENPDGRTHINEKKVCHTPQYSYPVFAGLNTNCTNTTSTGFDVSWSEPSPKGIYSQYYLYLKLGPSGFNFNDAIAGDAAYTKIAIPDGDTTYSFSSLLPSSSYQIGIKTYFQNPLNSDEFYDYNIKTITCSTSPATVSHQGWIELFAIGPKIDGIFNTRLPETIVVGPAGNTVPKQLDDPTKLLTRSTPVTGVLGVTASNQGIVRLVWEDFQLSGGAGGLYDFRSYPNTGYRVYRQPWKVSHNTLPPSIDDPITDWTQVTTTPIVPQRKLFGSTGSFINFGEFIDYTLTHPGGDEAKIYYYMVVPVMNNIPISYTTKPTDGVVKIILPPENMALAHRWIVNKDICGQMRLPIERNNNYRCQYNGLGSVGGYYDIEGHMLIDRYHLGCNFTRGTDPDPDMRCRIRAASTNPTFLGTATNPTTGVVEGDCIGSGLLGYGGGPNSKAFPGDAADNTGYIDAKYGAIFHGRYGYHTASSCSINTSSGGFGATWTAVKSFEATSVSTATSIIPRRTDLTPNGQGIGANMASNKANMPYANLGQVTSQKICMAFKVDLNSKEYTKRLARQREYIGFAGMDPFADNTTMYNVLNDLFQNSSSSNDQDCLVKGGGTVRTDAATRLDHSVFDFRKNNWPFNTYEYSPYILANGAQGDYSTESCVSRYGVSDISGNGRVYFSDQMWCDTWGCSFKYKDDAQTIPLVPLDPESVEYLKTADGQYLEFKASNSVGFSFGVSNDYASTVLADYFSIPTGHYLSCSGSACDVASDDNVLVTHKSEVSVVNANTQIFNYNLATKAALGRPYLQTGVSPLQLKGFSTRCGYTTSGDGFCGRFEFTTSDDLIGGSSYHNGTGRCMTLLKENGSGVIE